MSTSTNPQTASCLNIDEIEKKINKWKSNLKDIYCPISNQIMKDPTIIETGYTFESSFIKEWLLNNNNTCPITKQILPIPNMFDYLKKNEEKIFMTSNFRARAVINKKITKFIKKVMKHVKLWNNKKDLIDICLKLLDNVIEMINYNYCKEYLNDIYLLKLKTIINQFQFNLLNEEIFLDNYLLIINNLNNNELKILKLKEIENKLKKENNLLKLYEKLLMNENNNEDKQLFFTKYSLLENKNIEFIDTILQTLNNEKDLLEYYKILLDNSYNKYLILKKLILNPISDDILFINLIKRILQNINIEEIYQSSIDLQQLLIVIDKFENFNNEKIQIYLFLFNLNNDITNLEKAFDLNENNENIKLQLLNEYLKQELFEKYIDLYTKYNKDKIDTNILLLIKLLTKKNKLLEEKINNFNK
ncbi:hypothetical protein ABK040_002198 [Willaertia magna]